MRALIDATKALVDAETALLIATMERIAIDREYADVREHFEAVDSERRIAMSRVIQAEERATEARLMVSDLRHQRGDEQ